MVRPAFTLDLFRCAVLGAAAAMLGGSALVPALGRGPLVDISSPVTTLSSEELEKLPTIRDISNLALLQPGEGVTVAGRYNGIAIRGGEGSTLPVTPLPIRIGTLSNGTDVTNFDIPKTVKAGPVVLDFAPANGDPFSQQGHVYGFLRVWIEQGKLRSYQRAGFGYDIDFGRGPGQITLVITTVGPINYHRAGQTQTLDIGADGKATFSNYITALKGSPVGTPFTILPRFNALRLRR